MKLLVYVCICVLTGALGLWSIGLSRFISSVEDNDYCDLCTYKTECFSQHPIFNNGILLEELMLVAYICTAKLCRHKSDSHKILFSEVCFIIVNSVLIGSLYWSGGDILICIVFGVSVSMLFALSVVDWNTRYIPIEYTGVIFVCGLIRLFADVSNWWEYVIGLIAVSGFLYIVNKVGTPMIRKLHDDDSIDSVIGDGDIKLMAATGLLLGWKLNFVALGIGCIMGSIIHVILMKIKESDAKLAFGPYLSLGVYITMVCGEQLVSWYLNIIGYYSYYQ